MNFVYFLLLFFISSCFTKEGILKDPCQHEAFNKDIAKYSQAELLRLAKNLESLTFRDSVKSSCQREMLAKVYVGLASSSKASDYFSKAAKKMPELQDYFLLAKADCEYKKQNFDQAQSITKALLSSHAYMHSPQYATRVRQMLADIAVAERDDQRVVKTHEDLLAKGYQEDEVLLFNLASALTNIGEHEKANEVYKKLLVNFPTSKGAKKAEEIRSLSQYNLDLKEMEKHFDNLIKKLAFEKASQDADVLMAQASDENACHIASLATKAMVLNNQFDRGLKLSGKMVNKKHPSAKSLESHAWALSKAGRLTEAADFYGRFIKASKDKKEKAKGCFFRGFSFYEASLYSMALFSWQTCQDDIKDTEQYEDYLWYQALANILNEHYVKATGILSTLNSSFAKSADSEKYIYFLAYAQKRSGKKAESQALWSKLSAKKQPTYYVLLAREALGLSKPSGIDIPSDLSIASLAKTGDGKTALLLFHLGFKDEARDLLLRSKLNSADKTALLHHMGFYNDAWQRAYMLESKPSLVNNSVQASGLVRSSFPLPHRDIVTKACKKYGVSSTLLYAIIRSESGFATDVSSYRGAMGLMQMMPFVAKDLASSIAIPEFSHHQLREPQVAIELGALFVAMLKRQFGNPHLVLAAYNAGPHQVQKWLDSFGHLPVELFVERMPFKQTRTYVKKVCTDESIYHALSGQELRLAL